MDDSQEVDCCLVHYFLDVVIHILERLHTHEVYEVGERERKVGHQLEGAGVTEEENDANEKDSSYKEEDIVVTLHHRAGVNVLVVMAVLLFDVIFLQELEEKSNYVDHVGDQWHYHYDHYKS